MLQLAVLTYSSKLYLKNPTDSNLLHSFFIGSIYPLTNPILR
jgi:hypothetical protein